MTTTDPFIESQALLAMLVGEEDEAIEALRKLTKNELRHLRRCLMRLETLAGGVIEDGEFTVL